MISDLRSGDRLILSDRQDNYFEILDGRLHAGAIHIFDADKHETLFINESEIRAGISTGRLILHRKGMARVGVAAQYDNVELQSKVSFLLRILRSVEGFRNKLGVSFDAAIPFAREAYIEESAGQLVAKPFPSRATLFRAHKKQELGLAVLKGDKNKGNATARYSKELVEFIEEFIEENFLVTESKWTVLDLTLYANREARRRGLHNSSHNFSRKFVTSLINGLTVDADYDRMNPLNRVAGKSTATQRIRAGFVFARIEQDAVHLPFVVLTPHGVARTVYLVLAIDVCTGYPVGWHLVIGSPREMDSLRCLEMYLTPAKEARFKELGIKNAHSIYGTPSQVIFDNGPETKGGRIERLDRLEVDVKHCKAREAQGKPFIERINKSLKVALQGVEGCTRFEGKDGKRDPEAAGDKLITVDALEKWIVRWLYEDWVNSPLDRHRWDELLVESIKGKTPLERLKHLTEEMGYPITMPPSRQEWMAALFEHNFCTLSAKTGITLNGFRYKGEAISYLLAKYGDRASLHVIHNPDDFRQVYVFESDDMPLVTLTHEHARPDTPAWTFVEAKDKFKDGLLDWKVPEEKVQFLSDLDEAVTRNKKGIKTKRPGKREENQETVRVAKDQSAIQRSINRPISFAAPFGAALSNNPALLSEDLQATALTYDDAPTMDIVNRTTGDKLL